MSVRNALQFALIASLPLLAISGCGGDAGYHLSGKVSFEGKPVPEGKIYFFPDGTKGNKGQSGYANIKDGQFNTASAGGKKHIGGAMVVKIDGIDPLQQGTTTPGDTSGETVAKALFTGYEVKVELDKSSGTKDFDVPANAGEGRPNKPEDGRAAEAGPVDGV